MPASSLDDWTTSAPIGVLALVMLASMIVAAILGRATRRRDDAKAVVRSDGLDGVVVSAMLGLLALLLGFTFALAANRFETRRLLVVDEANAIGTTYLRAQLLDEPHRTRISGILVSYADNRLALAAATGARAKALSENNDRLITDLWAATAAAFDSVRVTAFANSLLETTNHLIDLDASRRESRRIHVPTEVYEVLFVYMVVTSAALGYALAGTRAANVMVGLMLLLLTLSFILVIDIDRSTAGGIREDESSMEDLRAFLAAQPPAVFDRWREPQRRASGAPTGSATR